MFLSFITGITFSSLTYAGNDSITQDNTQINQTQDNEDFSSIYKEEIKTEIEKLTKLRIEIEKKIKEDKEILKKIKEERKKLKKEREAFEKFIKEIEQERYKKLAKIFEKMDPELAGEKLSKMKDPKVAAYILYNMKDRKAGEVLNYVDPKMVNKITIILTDIKKKAKQ